MSEYKFEPIKLAKMLGGQLAEHILETPYSGKGKLPNRDDIWEIAHQFQAGLRALLSVNDRQEFSLPPFSGNDSDVARAQNNFIEVYTEHYASGTQISEIQKKRAVDAIGGAAVQLSAMGFETLAASAHLFVSDLEATHQGDVFHPLIVERFSQPSTDEAQRPIAPGRDTKYAPNFV